MHVRAAGIHVCCGGIVGMVESREDRVGLVHALATFPRHPEAYRSICLCRSKGTPLAGARALDPLEMVRTIAAARITMPASVVRLSAGREGMTDELQTLCLMAGAGSIFCGPKLLTTPEPEPDRDQRLLDRLGMATAKA